MRHDSKRRVVIIGGGLVGLMTALRLERRLGHAEADVTVVSPENFMVYQSLLPEVASGMLEPKFVVVPLRRLLRRTEVITGRLTGLDADRRVVSVEPYEGPDLELDYDHLVLAVGARTRVLPVPGLAERAVGFTTVAEALFLRNHILSRLEAAANTLDEDARRRALTFVFVGGGYSGVEALGELQDLAVDACGYFRKVAPEDMRWLLVEATERILPMVDERLSAYAAEALRDRGIEVHLETQLSSAEDGVMELSNGVTVEADTLVWAAGVEPQGIVGELGLATDERGHLDVDACLRVEGTEGIWSAGDCAAVPDLEAGGVCPPSAQYALRQARQLADNLVAALRGEAVEPFRYAQLGEFITIGRYDGVAELKGRTMRGFLPWYLRRLYHVARVPGLHRKLQVWLDWTMSMGFKRDPVSLGTVQHPRAPLESAASSRSDAA